MARAVRQVLRVPVCTEREVLLEREQALLPERLLQVRKEKAGACERKLLVGVNWGEMGVPRCMVRVTVSHVLIPSDRLYGTKCAGCNTGLCPEDMVRRAVDKVYHLGCFVCSLCHKELQTGEQLFLVQV